MMSTNFYDRCLYFLFSPPTIYQSPSTHRKRTSLPADHIPVTFNTLKENFSPRRPYTSHLQHTERELLSPPTIYQSPSTHRKRTSLPADHIPVTFNTLKENFSPRRPYTSHLQHTERELLSPPTIYQSPSTH